MRERSSKRVRAVKSTPWDDGRMALDMLERDAALSALHHAVGEAAAGRGSVVLVAGEAGIGKTCLVRSFAADAHARVRFAICDDLRAPRPLGPLARRARAGRRPVRGLLAELARESPTCSSSRTCTGPTTPRWTRSPTPPAASSACRRCCC
jgi:hypothetical protein